MSPYSNTLLACLLLLPFTTASSFGLCKGAKTDVKEDFELSDYGSMMNGVAVTWEHTAEGVVHGVQTPAACFDLAYYNASLPWWIESTSVEYDQETQICSIYRGMPDLNTDFNGTAKASVFIGIKRLCSRNFRPFAMVQSMLNATEADIDPDTKAALNLDDPATKAAYNKAGCCDIWFSSKRKT